MSSRKQRRAEKAAAEDAAYSGDTMTMEPPEGAVEGEQPADEFAGAEPGPVGGGEVSEGGEPEVTSESNDDTSADDAPENKRAVAGNNVTARNKARVFADIGKLGRESGLGNKSMVAMVERIVHAAEELTVVAADAEPLYKRFRDEQAKAAGKMAATDQTDNSLKANASKLRQLINLGNFFGKLAPSDGMFQTPWDVLECARDAHVQALRGEDKKRLKIKGTYETLVAVARKQLSDEMRGVVMTEDDVLGVVFNDDEPKEKTALDLVLAALDNAMKAKSGKADTETKAGRAGLDHGNLDDAIGHLRLVVSDLDPEALTKFDTKASKYKGKA